MAPTPVPVDNFGRPSPFLCTIGPMDTVGPPSSPGAPAPRPPQAWAPPPGATPWPPADRDDDLAVIALVSGVLGVFGCAPVGIVALIYGRRAQAACAAGTATNPRMAWWGHRLGLVSVVFLGIAAFTALGSLVFIVVLAATGAG